MSSRCDEWCTSLVRLRGLILCDTHTEYVYRIVLRKLFCTEQNVYLYLVYISIFYSQEVV